MWQATTHTYIHICELTWARDPLPTLAGSMASTIWQGPSTPGDDTDLAEWESLIGTLFQRNDHLCRLVSGAHARLPPDSPSAPPAGSSQPLEENGLNQPKHLRGGADQ